MDNQEFVTKIKRYAVDGTVGKIFSSLTCARLLGESSGPDQLSISGLAQRIADHNREVQRKVAWFRGLDDNDRAIIGEMLVECAELTGLSFVTFLDGVGGNTEGVFEIVQVVDENRIVVNPENSDMLHDLFSEVCERDRERRKSSEDDE